MSTQLKEFRSDFHVHTVLSPCADVEMIPPLIVESALDLGIKIIAITDHNSSANVQAVQRAAVGMPLSVLPGMEIQTKEDVHSLCLFDTLPQLKEFQVLVSASLPQIKNDPEHFGEQFVVDETGGFIRREENMLISSSSMSINEAFKVVTGLGGLFIPAHINRMTYGLIASLGFVPPEIDFPALEISKHITPSQAKAQIPSIGSTPLIQDGDVHRLDEFLGSMIFKLASPTIAEIKLAMANRENRSYEIA